MDDLILEDAIFKVLLYGDVYDFPLTAYEIWRYLPQLKADYPRIRSYLESQTTIESIDGYYFLSGRDEIVSIRRQAHSRAIKLWRFAIDFARLIYQLPYVRMLAITGSLAVNNVQYNSDIDLMIITSNGRLWLCRALILCVVHFAELRRITLCPNYLITERALSLDDHSLYSARELTQMVPLYGYGAYQKLREQNRWADQLLPNAQGAPNPLWDFDLNIKQDQRQLTFVLEKFLNGALGSEFENWEMKRKIQQLTLEQAHSKESCFTNDYCKGHQNEHGKDLVTKYQTRLAHYSLKEVG